MELNKNIRVFEMLIAEYPRKTVVKALLHLNGIAHVDLAKEAGLRPASVWCTLNGHRKNPHIMAIVSRRLGIPARELFDGQKS